MSKTSPPEGRRDPAGIGGRRAGAPRHIGQTLLIATGSFVAGALVVILLRVGTASPDSGLRTVSEPLALLSQSLGDASDATFALLFLDDREKSRRWHLARLETAVTSALEASKQVDRVETPLPNLLSALRKARPLLQASDSSIDYLEALSELEQWLEAKNRDAAKADR